MCTQTRFVGKNSQSNHKRSNDRTNRPRHSKSKEGCVSADVDFRTDPRSTHSSCDTRFPLKCLITKQDVSKCRHIFCLVFACLAVSVSADVAKSPAVRDQMSMTTTTSSTRPTHTNPNYVPFIPDSLPPNPQQTSSSKETGYIPSLPNDQFSEGSHNKSSFHQFALSPLLRLRLKQPDVFQNVSNLTGSNTEKHKWVRLRHSLREPLTSVPPPSVPPTELASYDEEQSQYFISSVFHRYTSQDYLRKEDLEKLLINLGLTPVNRSHSMLEPVSQDHQHGELNSSNSRHTFHQSSYSSNHTRSSNLSHPETDNHQNSSAVSEQLINSTFTDSFTEKSHILRLKRHVSSTFQGDTALKSLRPRRKHQHEEHKKCLSTKELLLIYKYDKITTLNAEHFLRLCPALIDQLDAGYCKQLSANHERLNSVQPDQSLDSGHQQEEDEHNHGSDEHNYPHDEHKHLHDGSHPHDHTHGQLDYGTNGNNNSHEHEVRTVPLAVWFYAQLSVLLISLCSVVGVVVIPNMKRVFYNHVLQFLVALAVGAMSGDAMLHLLPHSLLFESHHSHSHSHDHSIHGSRQNLTKTDIGSHVEDNSHDSSSHITGMYKGLVALLGIYSFFFLERLFTLFTKNRSGKSEKKQRWKKRCRDGKKKSFHMVNSNLENDGGNAPSCEEMVMVVHPNKALRGYADVSHEAYLHRCDESLVNSPTSELPVLDASAGDQPIVLTDSKHLAVVRGLETANWNVSLALSTASDAEIIGTIKEPERRETTHSHSHSHLTPDSVGPLSSVAMMIIIGDLIHNFCDGLAIGAAYAGSVYGGLSTSIAVFCHELPHEIGDFAVLIRSGLTLKKALCFNLISSLPSFLGALIGLAVGNVSSASSWIFAGVGGMFLYVTLVDLIPEMSSVYTKCDEPWFLHLLLQGFGIAVGTTIMMIISVSEESIMAAFS